MTQTHNQQNEWQNILDKHKMSLSCGCGIKNKPKNPAPRDVGYQCPLNCEGNTTYKQPEDCPVCNMQLLEVAMLESTILIEWA